MRKKFREFYVPTEKEKRKLWEDALFVFDTNILLSIYRFNKDTSDSLLSIMEQLARKEKIWIPYQVGSEFHSSRLNNLEFLQNSYDSLSSNINSLSKQIKNDYQYHPVLEVNKMEEYFEGLTKYIKEKESKHPDLIANDSILKRLTEIFQDRVGDPYSDVEMKKICEEGKERYAKKIPPGYKDSSKGSDNNEYGDLILWKQILDKAKSESRPIIFVTNDSKEDWWYKSSKNEKIMPLPALRKEIFEIANIDFNICTLELFMNNIKKYDTSISVKEHTVEEVKRLQNFDSEVFNESNYDSPRIHHSYRYLNKSGRLQEPLPRAFFLFRKLMHLLERTDTIDKLSSNSELVYEISKQFQKALGGRFGELILMTLRLNLFQLFHIMHINLEEGDYSDNFKAEIKYLQDKILFLLKEYTSRTDINEIEGDISA